MRTVVVFSGAGLSADSGLKTFRDKNGLWENHNIDDVSSHEGWFRNKKLVLDFYSKRREDYSKSKPHAGHFALAKLEEKFKVVHMTQNVDNLLEQAGCTNVKHLHGKLGVNKCEFYNGIKKDPKFNCDYIVESSTCNIGDLCIKCGGQMRPDVVWFGESVNLSFSEGQALVKEVKYNDGIFIVAGTSMQAYPAAYFVSYFSQVKNKFIVDKSPKKVSNYTLVAGNASEQLPILVETLLST